MTGIKSRALVSALVLFMAVGMAIGQGTINPQQYKNSGMAQGYVDPTGVYYGMLPYGGIQLRVTQASSVTEFYVEGLKGLGQNLGATNTTDLFVNSYLLMGIACATAGNENATKTITSLDLTTGKITSAAWGTALALKDFIALVPKTTFQGTPFSYTKSALALIGTGGVAGARSAGGTAISGAVAGGNILLDEVSVQVGATVPTGAWTAVYARVYTGGVFKLNVSLVKPDGNPLTSGDPPGTIGIANLNHIITTADVISVYTEGASMGTTSLTFTVTGRALTAGASVAAP